VTTTNHFTEAEALRILADTERVEGLQVEAKHCWHVGRGFASGLVRCEDGAMEQDRGLQIDRRGQVVG